MFSENFGKILKLVLIATAINIVASETQSVNVIQQIGLLSEQLAQLQQKLEFLDYLNATRAVQISTDNSVTPPPPPTNCVEAFDPKQGSGIYLISLPQLGLHQFAVYCMADPNNGQPWMLIQRRVDMSTDFYRTWAEYKYGFGDLFTNFFIGLDRLYTLTHQGKIQELWVQVKENVTANAYYDRFSIGDETSKYALNILGVYSGDAGDSLNGHRNMKFTTRDADNDNYSGNCADLYYGGWWYNACHSSNLNGLYGSDEYGKGLNWFSFRGHTKSVRYSHMAIRPSTTY